VFLRSVPPITGAATLRRATRKPSSLSIMTFLFRLALSTLLVLASASSNSDLCSPTAVITPGSGHYTGWSAAANARLLMAVSSRRRVECDRRRIPMLDGKTAPF